jgi:hypothetical protein
VARLARQPGGPIVPSDRAYASTFPALPIDLRARALLHSHRVRPVHAADETPPTRSTPWTPTAGDARRGHGRHARQAEGSRRPGKVVGAVSLGDRGRSASMYAHAVAAANTLPFVIGWGEAPPVPCGRRAGDRAGIPHELESDGEFLRGQRSGHLHGHAQAALRATVGPDVPARHPCARFGGRSSDGRWRLR